MHINFFRKVKTGQAQLAHNVKIGVMTILSNAG
jgi:hypothetical protein